MKISNILFAFIAFVGLGLLASCDVNDEFYKELDEEKGFQLVENLEYTLVDDDYETIGGGPEKYGSFSEYDPAADYLPDFLAEKYPTLDVTSVVNVTYQYYLGGLDYIRDYESLNYFELTKDDYNSMGEESGQPGKYDNFSGSTPPENYLPDFLSGKYPDAKTGEVVEVNYKFYASGVTSIVSDFYVFDGTQWSVADIESYELTAEDYNNMGEGPGSHDNFSDSDLPGDYLPEFLTGKYPDAVNGDLIKVIYQYYNGSVSTRSDYYTFNGTEWAPYGITVPVGVKLFVLGENEYEGMGVNNMFPNEEVYANYLPVFLEMKLPYAQLGDKVAIIFKYIDGKIKKGAVEYTKTASGWEEYSSTISQTDQYILTEKGWLFDPTVLYTMVAEDYQMLVDYVKANKGEEYVDNYGTAESYYGSSAYFKEFNIREGDYHESFAKWEDAVKEAVGVFLPMKFTDAVAQVDGVDVNYIITFAGYAGSMVDYTITFKCTKSGPNPEFEYVEGPTLK